ncbi:MAG: hypothetical protein IJZ95_02535 [Oscillospiraceae bacterium]|nr:hypothetical protein [Oscillospiraceae bacterium]
MQVKPKLGIAAGACSILLAGAAMFPADGNSNSVTITLDKNASAQLSDQTIPPHDQANTLEVESIGLEISFSAFPDADSNDILRFTFNDPDLTIYVPTEITYPPDEMLSVSGTISETGQDHLTLTNTVITPIPETRQSANAPSDPINQKPQGSTSQSNTYPQEQKVFVSSTGKYHSVTDCSGMRSYSEMSLSEAIEAGCSACKKCN